MLNATVDVKIQNLIKSLKRSKLATSVFKNLISIKTIQVIINMVNFQCVPIVQNFMGFILINIILNKKKESF